MNQASSAFISNTKGVGSAICLFKVLGLQYYGYFLTLIAPDLTMTRDDNPYIIIDIRCILILFGPIYKSNVSRILPRDFLSILERKRLIQKGINFVVPGKQLFLPELLIDLREQFPRKKEKKDSLTPSSQALLLFHILHRYEKIENLSFKELAQKFGYTQMAITKIADDLRHNELCTIEGTKEKYIHFHGPIPELWHMAKPVLVSPVIKRVYTDTLPPMF